MSDVQAAESGGLGNNHPPPTPSDNTDHDAAPLDGHALIESVASEMGWSPQEKWKGDPDKWRPADQFLKATPKVVKSLKEQNATANRVATQQMERVRAEYAADAERRIAEAIANGDTEAGAKATADLKAATSKSDPQTDAFVAENAWFNSNRKATRLALETAEEIAQAGGSVAEQLAGAEKEVQKRFPELFEDDEASEPPARKQPPAVEGGQRTAAPAARKKGFSDLPRDIQRAITPKQLKSWGLTEAQYAESYFKENA